MGICFSIDASITKVKDPDWIANLRDETISVIKAVAPSPLEILQVALHNLRLIVDADLELRKLYNSIKAGDDGDQRIGASGERALSPEEQVPLGHELQNVIHHVSEHPILLYFLAAKYANFRNPEAPAVVVVFAEELMACFPDKHVLLTNMATAAVMAVICDPGDKKNKSNSILLAGGKGLHMGSQPWNTRVRTVHVLLDLRDDEALNWPEVMEMLQVHAWRYFQVMAILRSGLMKRLGAHHEGLGLHCLRVLHSDKKHYTHADVVSMLLNTNMNQIPQDFFETLFLNPGDKEYALSGDANGKPIGSGVWQNILTTVNETRGDVGGILRQDVVSYVLERIPCLNIGTSITCMIQFSVNAHSKKLTSTAMYDKWANSGLHFVDPRTIDLKVRAAAPIKPDELLKIVRQTSANGELELQQALTGVPGTMDCFLCNGNGIVDESQGIDDQEREELRTLPRASSAEEKREAALEFRTSIANADWKGIRRSVHRRPSLSASSPRCSQASEGMLGMRATWFYAAAWEEPAQPLPYDGNMQLAMQNHDRDAIKLIMKARSSAPAVVAAPAPMVKFSDVMSTMLEEAFTDSQGTVINISKTQATLGEDFLDGLHVNIDMNKMLLIDESTRNTRKLHRDVASVEVEENPFVQCWVCKGAGKISRWLERSMTAGQLTMTKSAAAPACLICGDDGKYGMSVDCEHLYCENCLVGSLQAILASGQFPAHCTQCRADAGGKAGALTCGEVTRPVLTFLQERGLFSKAFQFRFVTAMQRVGIRGAEATQASELFNCPAKCGLFLEACAPVYDVFESKSYIRLASCPCGARICLACRKHVKGTSMLHECKIKAAQSKARELQQKKDDEEMMKAMSKIGKPCPVCKMFIQKNEGCEWMMCGCTSHGSLKEALRNGGCGIAFKWNNLEVADDPCGFKDVDGGNLRGRPMTARMIKDKVHAKCKNPMCNFFKSTDGMRLAGVHKEAPSNKRNNGGEYCCSDCASGKKSHHSCCHRIPVPSFNKAAAEAALAAKRAQDGNAVLTKYFSPFDAYGIRIVWNSAYCAEAADDATKKRGAGTLDWNLQILGVDEEIVRLHGAATYNMFGTMNHRVLQEDSANLSSSSMGTIGMLEITFQEGLQRITGMRARNLHAMPFQLFYCQEPVVVAQTTSSPNVDSNPVVSNSATWIEYVGVSEKKRLTTDVSFIDRIIGSLGFSDEKSESSSGNRFKDRLVEVQERIDALDALIGKEHDEERHEELKRKKAEQEKMREEQQREYAAAAAKTKREESAKRAAEAAAGPRLKQLTELFAERKGFKNALGDEAVLCPACAFVLMKLNGDDTMMCGCEAKAAGGTMEKAILGGGCGYEFNFRTLLPANDNQGSKGRPLNDRQWRFDKKFFSIK